jgi:hypothetical protein
MSKGISVGGNNKGLTVAINLWALEKYLDKFDAKQARSYIQGQVTNAETRKHRIFNDAGQLLTILGEWNVAKFKQLQREANAKAK